MIADLIGPLGGYSANKRRFIMRVVLYDEVFTKLTNRMYFMSPLMEALSSKVEFFIISDATLVEYKTASGETKELSPIKSKRDSTEDIHSIDRVAPDVVITSQSTSQGREIAKHCYTKGIKVVDLQEGFIGNAYSFRNCATPSAFLMWGPFDAEVMMAGNPNVILTGQPRFDVYFKEKPTKAALCEEYGFNPSKKKILLCDSLNSYGNMESFWEMMALAKDEFDGFYMGHPSSQSNEEFVALSAKYGYSPVILSTVVGNELLGKRSDIYKRDIYSMMDVIVSNRTTVSLEALMCGTPVVVNTKEMFTVGSSSPIRGWPHIEPVAELTKLYTDYLYKFGCYLYAESAIDLRKAIDIYLANPIHLLEQRQRQINYYHLGTDGNASTRVVDALLNLTKKG